MLGIHAVIREFVAMRSALTALTSNSLTLAHRACLGPHSYVIRLFVIMRPLLGKLL
jgi:hypothetical protein